ncbi:sterol 3-beta-glucosyltransferase UGT80B1-like isoform X2 [Salvia hispanica]|uniref:sterol 3-beta-glucosyltransferase UGT80B1-like isoform X2 n=1 Tax=Salvia hispanica TaxID=49212 RepID=UPI0020093789|nr:sterol 3-beta-glucosyltransferase UGT80B1-like isoform X2 [Salvia hispanica]
MLVGYISMSDCNQSIPKLSIAILVVGTRGDVQPFLAVARKLQEYGHCVRLATHSEFRGLVKSAGVDFYPIGGDPRVIVEGFVKTQKILLTSWQDIAIQLKQLKAVMESLLQACTQPDPITGDSFRAQAIIANPPAYGRVDVAEALGVPLHIFFTVPWTPTCAFPHPFIPHISHRAGNWLSYFVVDILIWWGLRGYINKLRKNKLNLSPINGLLDTNQVSISHLPTTYMWSPCVLPKPNDWGPLVDIVGYCFVDLGSKYEPPQELLQWLQKGAAPIYIGFGSMPLENPEKTRNIVLEALKNTGRRGIVDRGWGGLATHAQDVAEDVFLLTIDCPHDWLFPQCCAVVHHGGAGTTATGLKAGCPTTIVPFCGDQSLWGAIIYERGVGPAPIPIAHLSVESLSKAIRFMLQPEVKSRAVDVAVSVRDDDGAAAALDSFHRHLPLGLPLAKPEQGDHVQTVFGYLARFCCRFCAPLLGCFLSS